MDSNTANTIVDSFTQQIVTFLKDAKTANSNLVITESSIKEQFKITRTMSKQILEQLK